MFLEFWMWIMTNIPNKSLASSCMKKVIVVTVRLSLSFPLTQGSPMGGDDVAVFHIYPLTLSPTLVSQCHRIITSWTILTLSLILLILILSIHIFGSIWIWDNSNAVEQNLLFRKISCFDNCIQFLEMFVETSYFARNILSRAGHPLAGPLDPW